MNSSMMASTLRLLLLRTLVLRVERDREREIPRVDGCIADTNVNDVHVLKLCL